MFEEYKVAVKLSLNDGITKGLVLISQRFKSLGVDADVLQTKLKALKDLAFVGAGLFVGGMAIGAPFVYAISKAAELQKQMIGIQIATHGTTKQMDDLRASMEKASSTTIFSTVDVAKMAKIVATSNAFTTPQLTALMPSIAKFADVQAMMKGTPYSSSVLDAVKLMHLAQKYSPSEVTPYFNTLTKASFMMPGGISQLQHALAYSMPMGQTALGIDPQTMVMITALLNRLGFSGSRGGTNLVAAMTRTIPGMFGSGLLRGKSHEALADMGFIDSHGHSKFMEKGKFDAFLWIQGLTKFVHDALIKDPIHGRERIAIDFQHAFGSQGGKIAALLSSPKSINQLGQMFLMFSQLADTGAIQNQFYQKSVSQQFIDAKTNFQNVMIELGTNLLPLATHALTDLNNALNILIPWMRKNKELVKDLSLAFVGLSGALLFGGLVIGLTVAFRGLGLALAFLGAGGAIGALTKLFMLMGKIGGLALVGGASYEATKAIVKHYGIDDKIGSFLYRHSSHYFKPSLLTSLPGMQANTPGPVDQVNSHSNTHASSMNGAVYLDGYQVGKFLFGSTASSMMNQSQLASTATFRLSQTPTVPGAMNPSF